MLRGHLGAELRPIVALGDTMETDRAGIVLAGLAAAKGEQYTPVQLQKFFFLVDRNVGKQAGGPFFDFQPFDYGAFDPNVYDVVTQLQSEGLAAIDSNPGTPIRTYSATRLGVERGEQILAGLPDKCSEYMVQLSAWIRRLSFSELVSAVYRLYPETKVNSIFRDRR